MAEVMNVDGTTFAELIELPTNLTTTRYEEHMVQEMVGWTWMIYAGRALTPINTQH